MSETLHRCLYLLSVAAVFMTATGCSMPVPEAGDRSTDKEAVLGVTWEWAETITPAERIEVATPNRYTIRLKRNGEAQIRYDCNHGGSLYDISDGTLSFGPLTATRIPCPAGSQASAYMHQLAAVNAFFTENGFLYLELPADGGTMRFRKAD